MLVIKKRNFIVRNTLLGATLFVFTFGVTVGALEAFMQQPSKTGVLSDQTGSSNPDNEVASNSKKDSKSSPTQYGYWYWQSVVRVDYTQPSSEEDTTTPPDEEEPTLCEANPSNINCAEEQPPQQSVPTITPPTRQLPTLSLSQL